MEELHEETECAQSDGLSEKELREELYDQHDVSLAGQTIIEGILPKLEDNVDTESRYDIDPRSKIQAEIALMEAYRREPKVKIFTVLGLGLLAFDTLHALDPAVYGIVFIGAATVNGFVTALRSPSMMVAELEGLKDEDGMPANYRAKAFSSVNTNITILLFVIALGIQLLTTTTVVEGEVITQNLADGMVSPWVTGSAVAVLFALYVNFEHGDN